MNYKSVPFAAVKMTGKAAVTEAENEREKVYHGCWQAALGADITPLSANNRYLSGLCDYLKQGSCVLKLGVAVPGEECADKLAEMQRNIAFFELSRQLLVNLFEIEYIGEGDAADIVLVPEGASYRNGKCKNIIDMKNMTVDDAMLRLRPFKEVRIFTDITFDREFVCHYRDLADRRILFIAQAFSPAEKIEACNIIINLKGKYLPKKLDPATGKTEKVSYRILGAEDTTEIFYDLTDTEALLLSLEKTNEVSSDITITCPGCRKHSD